MEIKAEVMSFETIKATYPNQWVLLGDVVLKKPQLQASLHTNLKSGIVLLHDKDRFIIAHKAKDVRTGYEHITLVYTGEFPKNRKIWL